MTALLSVLSGLFGLGNLVLFVIVLIKLFQQEGVGMGILGIICSLYTFIWGWMKHKEQQLTTIMTVWSVILVVQIILSVLVQVIVIGQMR